MITKSKIKNQKSKLKFKIQNFAFLFVILIFAFCVLNSNSYADIIPSTELINNAKEYDGKIIDYGGEVIGDVMARGEYCWININDGVNAVGIWVDKYSAKNITYTGGYRSRGDLVKVTGIFHRACLEHGGDLDIHAISFYNLAVGRQFLEKINIRKRNFAIALLAVLCFIWISTFLKRK